MEFSLTLLESSFHPPPPLPFSFTPKEEKEKPSQISEPASAPSILQGNGCHWVSTPLIRRESVVLRPFIASHA